MPLAALAASAFPNSSSSADRTALVKQLQDQVRTDEFKAKFWSQEPITQQDYYVQVQEDERLIARIEASEPVSDTEIEQALERVDTAY
jgi:hypothetical protein